MFGPVCGVVILCLFYTVTGDEATNGPIIGSQYGKLQGIILHIPDNIKPAYAFLNVPYAAPPVNELRFKPPQPLKPWSGVRDATKFGKACIQNAKDFDEKLFDMPITYPEETSEDCLHLNIYTPSTLATKPVMFFIHGGGFTSGWAEYYDGRVLAILEDVVVVIIQHRLATFGFLTTGQEDFPGNMGFKDQVAALKWVKENIATFGGDPEKITIFGESAGSISVLVMMLNPEAKGLFQRGIMQSGSMFDNSLLQTRTLSAKQSTVNLAQSLDCPSGSIQTVMDCLQKQPAEKILPPPGMKSPPEFSFLAVIDGNVIPDLPRILLMEGRFHKDIDLMIGVCQVEGYMLSQLSSPDLLTKDVTLDDLQMFISQLLTMVYPSQPNLIETLTPIIMKEYKLGPSVEEVRRAIIEFGGEVIISNPTYKTAVEFKDKSQGNIFFYEMSFRPPTSTKPDWVIMDHFEDLFYTFGVPLMEYDGRYNFTEKDKQMSRMVIRYWANFAKTGDPNGDDLVQWPSFRDDKAYLHLKLNPEADRNFRSERMRFWLETIPEIVENFNKANEQSEHTEL